MKHRVFQAFFLLTSLQAPMASAGTGSSVWSSTSGPAQPLHYVESIRVTQSSPQIARVGSYAPTALFMLLYPSIDDSKTTSTEAETNSETLIASKNRGFQQFRPRVNLSPSYVQEFAYIDTYSNIRKYEDNFNFPSIRMNLPLPWFGGGFGGGYQRLQFGFGPKLFRF
jgi:hypothetical protein